MALNLSIAVAARSQARVWELSTIAVYRAALAGMDKGKNIVAYVPQVITLLATADVMSHKKTRAATHRPPGQTQIPQ